MRQTQQSVLNGQAMVMIITFAAMLFTLDYDNVRVFSDNVPSCPRIALFRASPFLLGDWL